MTVKVNTVLFTVTIKVNTVLIVTGKVKNCDC